MRPFILALGAFAAITSATLAQAQAPSLADVLERAWQASPQAQSQPQRAAGIDAERALASALFAGPPTVALAHQTDRFGRNAGAREVEAELALPIWLPGEKDARRHAAASESRLLSHEQAALHLQLAGQLREALWQLALADNAAQLARARLEADRQIEADVARRVDAGELARADLLLARGETLAARSALAEAEQALLAARQDYLQVVGEDLRPVTFIEAPASVRDVVLEAHPLLVASRSRVEAARARANVVARTGRENPELSFVARRERGDVNERFGNVAVVAIKIPFGSDARNAPRTAQAQAELTEAEVEYRRRRFALEQDMRKAEAEADSARQRVELAESRLALSRENFQLMKTAFSLGEKSLFEFQRIQTSLDAATLAASQAAIELNRAYARLNQAFGVLP